MNLLDNPHFHLLHPFKPSELCRRALAFYHRIWQSGGMINAPRDSIALSRRRMDPEIIKRPLVDAFVIEEIESVPHLEALLLLYNSRPRKWSVVDMARAIYLSDDDTSSILRDLAQRQLIVVESGLYSYNASHPKGDIVAMLDSIYRREIVRISNLIHSKPSASVRAFARAFKLTKD